MSNSKNYLQITKSNSLIEASYRLSTQEIRIILLAISKAQAKQVNTLNDQDMYIVSAQDYSDLTGIEIKNCYKDLKLARQHLFDRSITLYTAPDGTQLDEPIRTRWVQADVEKTKGIGAIGITFAKYVVPYLSQLKTQFTRYHLNEAGKLPNAYSIQIFELLAQYKSIGNRTIDIQWLREKLGLGTKYKEMKNFKVRVIEPSIKAINECTDLTVSYSNIKQGRKVIALNFKINSTTILTTKKLSEDYIKTNARAGESWEQAKKRLAKEL